MQCTHHFGLLLMYCLCWMHTIRPLCPIKKGKTSSYHLEHLPPWIIRVLWLYFRLGIRRDNCKTWWKNIFSVNFGNIFIRSKSKIARLYIFFLSFVEPMHYIISACHVTNINHMNEYMISCCHTEFMAINIPFGYIYFLCLKLILVVTHRNMEQFSYSLSVIMVWRKKLSYASHRQLDYSILIKCSWRYSVYPSFSKREFTFYEPYIMFQRSFI